MMCLHGVQQHQQRLQAFVTESLPASQQGSHFVNGGVQFVKNFCIVHTVHPRCAHRTAKQKSKEEVDIKVVCILYANVTKTQRMQIQSVKYATYFSDSCTCRKFSWLTESHCTMPNSVSLFTCPSIKSFSSLRTAWIPL